MHAKMLQAEIWFGL